ncbi:MAG: hypothetical protein HQ581_00490 [Planctomycetes bacterium]|nr:hypothetical protein [Planctomycetota bacterium]
MTFPTEIETFRTNIQSVPEIMAIVDGVAEDARFQESTAAVRADPVLKKLTEMASGHFD